MVLRCHFSSWLVAGLPFNAQVMKKGSSGTSDSSKQQDKMDDIKIDESNFDEVCIMLVFHTLYMYLICARAS